jgi:hypothetical protein
VVGARTAEQVHGNLARYRAVVPAELWDDLRAAGLLPAATSPTVSHQPQETP